MLRATLLVLLFTLTAADGGFAQTTRPVDLSDVFTGIAGTPRVIQSASANSWLVVWRQDSALKLRIVTADGTLTPVKNIVAGVNSFERNFDVARDTNRSSYLVAFENASGLRVLSLNASLAVGSGHLIEGGATNSNPRLVYDPAGKRYFLLWLGSQDGTRSVLRWQTLDSLGNPKGKSLALSSAAPGKTFGSLSIARNPKDGNVLTMLLQSNNSAGSLLKLVVSGEGIVVGPTVVFQAVTPGLKAVGDVALSSEGSGFGFWSDKFSIKRRRITTTGEFAGPAAVMNNMADANSLQTTIAYDSSSKQFVAGWTKGKQTLALRLDATTGSVLKQPAAVGSSTFDFVRDADVAVNSDGNALMVWEDSTVSANVVDSSVQFHVRGAILTSSSSGGFSISGNAGDKFVTISFSGPNAPRPVTSARDGSYKQSGFSNGTYTITPNKSCVSFNPGSTKVRISGTNIDRVNFKAKPSTLAPLLIVPNSPMTNTALSFDASRSTSSERVRNYTWDFGDGTRKTCNCPLITHIYENPSTCPIQDLLSGCGTQNYRIRVTLEDVQGCSASDESQISVDIIY